MKVLHITTSVRSGGAETAMFRLIQSNNKNTHSVISLTGDGMYAEKLRKIGVTVHLLQLKGQGIPLKTLWQLRRLIKSEKPDIVQTWMYHANLVGGVVARCTGIKAIFWNIRTSNPQLGNIGKNTQRLNLLCGKLANIVPARIISCAHKATDTHIKFGYPKSKIQTICNGYDFSTLQFNPEARASFREKWQIGKDELLLGIVARWDPQKDHKTLFDALNRLRDSSEFSWKLVLVGPDITSDNQQLMDLLEQFNIVDRFILVGHENNITNVMSALDIHILSSTDEGFPNVIAEAMACGTPCVSTDAGDAKHIIDNTGWVCPPRDAQALSVSLHAAINEFNNSAAWTKRRNEASSRIRTHFSIEKMTEAYDDAWSTQLRRYS